MTERMTEQARPKPRERAVWGPEPGAGSRSRRVLVGLRLIEDRSYWPRRWIDTGSGPGFELIVPPS